MRLFLSGGTMSGIIVSVIVPFLESNNKLIDTLSSISDQKNISQDNIEVLIFHATENTEIKGTIANMTMCVKSSRQIYYRV